MNAEQMERRLLRQLEKVRRRQRHLRSVAGWAVAAAVSATAAVIWLALNRWAGLPANHAIAAMSVAAGLGWLLATWLGVRSASNYRDLAARIERRFPELSASLLTAVEQQPIHPYGRFGYLQSSVIQQAMCHAYSHSWTQAIPWSRLASAHLVNLLAWAMFAAALAGLWQWRVGPLPNAAKLLPAAIAIQRGATDVEVQPGDAEVERGGSLLVQARFRGPLPAEVWLVVADSAGDETRSALTRSLADPVFAARVPDVQRPFEYRVEFDAGSSPAYRVTVFEYPRLEKADARLVYPAYTSLAERTIEDVRRVSAVEGTVVTLDCRLNKPVAEAKLVGRNGDAITLTADAKDNQLWRTELTLTTSQRWELQLTDDAGRRNKLPHEFVFQVIPNKPPDLKVVQPGRDTQASPLEELDLAATAYDDFGLRSYGLTFSFAGDQPHDVTLGEGSTAKDRINLRRLVALEDLAAQPDQLLSYHFWAEDVGPDGQPRRVESDLFFAEVRPFEEIYRQGEQPPEGESPSPPGGAAQQAEQLAELQKQIVNGIWKLVRREAAAGPPGDAFASDVEVLTESQQAAIEQLEQAAAEIQDARSLTFVAEAQRHMAAAAQELRTAHGDAAVTPLRPALSAAQQAYQSLLKLRAREHEVVRRQQQSRPGQPSGGASSRNQQQLDQLELKDNENRYETERTAQEQQQQQDRETRQVLNRLRELARRQSDLNERLKELQSALDEAQTEPERQEVARQLKRLQEEQEAILRESEELQERMEQPQNEERMADAQQQLAETRENLRQASEALQEGRASRALASGTRAQRDLEELREEFRRQASNRFAEEMREMRSQAEEMQAAQDRIAESLDQAAAPNDAAKQTSLRETAPPTEQTQAELQQQQQRLKQLLDRVQDTVVEAEEPEPLLAEKLYDAARDARQANIDRQLEMTRRLLASDLTNDARAEESRANRGIDQLTDRIRQAAEGVLGDETESLRRALDSLRQLQQEVANEASRQPGEPDPATAAAPSRSPQDSPENAPGDPAREPTDDGSRNPGQQAADQSPAERRPEGGAGQPNPSAREPQPDAEATPSGESQPNGGERSQTGSADPSGDRRRASSLERLGDPANVERAGAARSGGVEFAPITGESFTQWSDRLRDVEEMVGDPELRAEAARIRGRAREFRGELKRHSQEPNWDLVRLQVVQPLAELRDRVAEELLRRTGAERQVPLDRDPVPAQYESQVRRYYERLGAGK